MQKRVLSLKSAFFYLLVGVNSLTLGQESVVNEVTSDDLYLMSLDELVNVELTTSALTAISLQDSPSSTSVITATEIERSGYRTIWEALESVPGVTISRWVGQRPRVHMRGLDSMINEKVLYLVNGQPTNVFAWGPGVDEALGPVPIENIQQIEVVRGASSALFGEGGIAGVINVITKRPEAYDGAAVTGRVGSNEYRAGSLAYGESNDEFEFSVFAFYSEDEGETLKAKADGITLASGFPPSLAPVEVIDPQKSFVGETFFGYKGWELNVNYQYYQTNGYLSWVSAQPPSEKTSLDESFGLQVDIKKTFELSDSLRITPRYSFVEADHDETMILIPGLGPNPENTSISPSGNLMVTPEVSSRMHRGQLLFEKIIEDHRILASIGFAREDILRAPLLDLNGEISPDPAQVSRFLDTSYRDSFSAFVQDIYQMSTDFKWFVGARYDHLAYENSEFSDIDVFKPRIAAVYQLSDATVLKGILSQGFRAPSIAELSKLSPMVVGSPDVGIEEISTAELLGSYTKKNFYLSAGVFISRIEDVILRRSLDDLENDSGLPTYNPLVAPPFSETQRYQNAGDQKQYGLEIEGGWNITDRILMRSNYSFVNLESWDTGEEAPTVFRHMANISFDITLPCDMTLFVQANLRGSQKEIQGHPAGFDADYPGYALFNANLNLPKFLDGVRTYINVRNVFDKEYFDPQNQTYSQPLGYPARGREIFAGFRGNF